MARFGLAAFQPARDAGPQSLRKCPRARALFAGLAAHSFLSSIEPLSSAVGLVLGCSGACRRLADSPRRIAAPSPDALIAHLQKLGGTVHTSRRIMHVRFSELDSDRCTDALRHVATPTAVDRRRSSLTPSVPAHTAAISNGSGRIQDRLCSLRACPVAGNRVSAARSPCILGGTFEEIAAVGRRSCSWTASERPYVLGCAADALRSTRAPHGKHILWAYCHVPNGSAVDMTARIEAQIERFAPGFRDCMLARRSFTACNP